MFTNFMCLQCHNIRGQFLCLQNHKDGKEIVCWNCLQDHHKNHLHLKLEKGSMKKFFRLQGDLFNQKILKTLQSNIDNLQGKRQKIKRDLEDYLKAINKYYDSEIASLKQLKNFESQEYFENLISDIYYWKIHEYKESFDEKVKFFKEILSIKTSIDVDLYIKKLQNYCEKIMLQIQDEILPHFEKIYHSLVLTKGNKYWHALQLLSQKQSIKIKQYQNSENIQLYDHIISKGEPQDIQCLTIFSCGRLNKQIPVQINALKNLQQLHINFCSVTQIQNLSQFISLKILDLHSNRIIKIENLNNLTKLEQLNLSDNKITVIQNLDCLKTSLISLDLCDNLIRLVQNLNRLQKLKVLKLENNQIEIASSQTQINELKQRGVKIDIVSN